MSRPVYVDAGCNDGASVVQFLQSQRIPHEWDVYAFDPLPQFLEEWDLIQRTWPNVQFIRKGLWIEDTQLVFSELKRGSTGSSFITDKTSFPEGVLYHADVIDFSAWLEQFRVTKPYLLVKLDIEGAEFAVLEKVIQDKNQLIISKLLVEWHDTKMGERSAEYLERRRHLERHLIIPVEEWTQ